MKTNNNAGSHRFSFLGIITHNFWLKVVSLLFALLLWSYVINETNPMRSKIFDNMSVSVLGMSQLNQNGLAPLEDLVQTQLKARFTVNVSHKDYKKLKAENFDVSIDLSGITTTGSNIVPIRVKSVNGDVNIVSVSPSSIELKIDSLETSVVPLQINTSGILPENLVRGNATVSPDKITLKGPKQYISRISTAVVDVDLSKMSDSYSANMPYSFYDNMGNRVTPVNVTASAQSVLVNMGVKTKRSIKIDYTDAFINQDKLEKNMELKNIITPTAEIAVYGSKEVLDKLDSIKVRPVDLTGAGTSMTDVLLTPILPEGVSLLNAATQLHASVVISEMETSKSFSVPIKSTGLNTSAYKSQLSSSSATVTLYGPISKLNNLSALNISLNINLADKGEGTYDILLTPSLSANFSISEVTASAQPTSIKVTITKK